MRDRRDHSLDTLAVLLDELARADRCSLDDEVRSLLSDAALARAIGLVFEHAGRAAQVWAQPLLDSRISSQV